MIFYKEESTLFYPKEGMYRRSSDGKGTFLITEDNMKFETEDEKFYFILES